MRREWSGRSTKFNTRYCGMGKDRPQYPCGPVDDPDSSALTDAVVPVLRPTPTACESLGMRSANPVLQDFAALAAIYLRTPTCRRCRHTAPMTSICTPRDAGRGDCLRSMPRGGARSLWVSRNPLASMSTRCSPEEAGRKSTKTPYTPAPRLGEGSFTSQRVIAGVEDEARPVVWPRGRVVWRLIRLGKRCSR